MYLYPKSFTFLYLFKTLPVTFSFLLHFFSQVRFLASSHNLELEYMTLFYFKCTCLQIKLHFLILTIIYSFLSFPFGLGCYRDITHICSGSPKHLNTIFLLDHIWNVNIFQSYGGCFQVFLNDPESKHLKKYIPSYNSSFESVNLVPQTGYLRL